MGLLDIAKSVIAGPGNMVEGIVEQGLQAIGVDAKTADKFGDLAGLVVNVQTGNVFGILTELPDLLENSENDAQQQGANMHEGDSFFDMINDFLNNPQQRDHRRQPSGPNTGNREYATPGCEYYDTNAYQPTGTWRDLFAPSGAVPPFGSNDPQAWMQYAGRATGEELKNLVLSGQIPPDVLKDPAFTLAMQEAVQASARMFDLVESMLTAQHETAKGALSFRV